MRRLVLVAEAGLLRFVCLNVHDLDVKHGADSADPVGKDCRSGGKQTAENARGGRAASKEQGLPVGDRPRENADSAAGKRRFYSIGGGANN